MLTVTATDFAKHFGRYQDTGQRENIAVTSHGRVIGYFISEKEYEIYMKLRAKMPKQVLIY